MNCKSIYFIFKGITRITEIIIELCYILTSDYTLDWILLTNIVLFITPTSILMLILTFWGLCAMKSFKNCKVHFRLTLFIALHPLGFPDLLLSYYLLHPKTNQSPSNPTSPLSQNLQTLSYLSKNCALLEVILQSLPQACLKTYNNFLVDGWNTTGILTITFSLISIIISTIQALRVLETEPHIVASTVTVTKVERIVGKTQVNDSYMDNSMYPIDLS